MKNIVSEIHDAYAAKLSEPKLPSKVYLGKKTNEAFALGLCKGLEYIQGCISRTNEVI